MRPNRSAFTLVELLVVTGIIALLIGILLPALSKARQTANRAACLSNLHNLGVAMAMYTAQYKGVLPEGQDAQATVTWVGLLLYQMGQGNGDALSAGTQDANKTRGVFLCKDATRFDPQPRSNYACHPLLMPDLGKTYPAAFPEVGLRGQPRRPYNVTRLPNPSDLVLVFDTTQAMDDGGAYVTALNLDANRISNTAATSPPCTYLVTGTAAADPGQSVDGGVNQDMPATTATPATDPLFRWANIRWRHSGNTMANFLFADGHADGLRYKSRYQTQLLRRNVDVPQP